MSIKAIYLPGIVDHRPWLQNQIIKLWRLRGVDAEYVKVGWSDSEPFEKKLNRFVARVDELAEDGGQVAVIGTSAGASAALNLYMARKQKICAVVFICGKVHGLKNVNERYFRINPAFRQSLVAADELYVRLDAVDRKKMMYIYTGRDKTVPPSANILSHVEQKKVLAIGHISGIYLTLIFRGGLIASFIKNRSKISN